MTSEELISVFSCFSNMLSSFVSFVVVVVGDDDDVAAGAVVLLLFR